MDFEYYINKKNEAEKIGAQYALSGNTALAVFFANAAQGYEQKAYNCIARTGISSCQGD